MNDDEFFAQTRGAGESSMRKSRMDDSALVAATSIL